MRATFVTSAGLLVLTLIVAAAPTPLEREPLIGQLVTRGDSLPPSKMDDNVGSSSSSEFGTKGILTVAGTVGGLLGAGIGTILCIRKSACMHWFGSHLSLRKSIAQQTPVTEEQLTRTVRRPGMRLDIAQPQAQPHVGLGAGPAQAAPGLAL